MAGSGNIIDIMQVAVATRRVQLSDASRRLLQDCREMSVRTLPSLLSGLFERLDDALFDMADKSDRDALQTVYFDVMRTVRKARARIGGRFLGSVTDRFDRLWGGRPGEPSERPAVAEADMALVGDDDLEETLAVTNMISKGENLYRRELYVLNERLSSLGGGVPIDNRINPLGPGAICQAFRDAVADLAVDVPVKLVMYKLFDKQVMHYVGGMYDELNALMAREGILPNLIPKAHRNPVSPALRGEQPGAATAREGDRRPATHGAAPADDVLGALRALLDVQRRSPGSGETGGDALPQVAPADLVAALSSLQHTGAINPVGAGVAAAVLAPQQVRYALAQQFGIGGGAAAKTIGPLEDDIIEVVMLLFEAIAKDRAIPDAMKVLIGRLQIPVLKAALLDRSFFSNTAHPARRLLNRLATAALGWSGEADAAKDLVYGRLCAVVERVLSEFNRDLDVFSRLDEDMAGFVEEQQRGARVAEERAAQITRGREQLALAKRRVADEVAGRLADCATPVPEVVRALVEDGWKDVMLLALLRQGPESHEWAGVLRVADDLLWSVAPKASFEERQELLQRIPDLLRKLREGLASISFDQHRMNTLLKELQSVHIASLRSPGDAPVGPARSGARPSPGGGRATSAAPPGAGQPQDACFQQAARLEVGSWLDLLSEDGKPRRVKLSWRSNISDLCVLVNSRGTKVMELELQELAGMLRAGRALPIEHTDLALVDRAIAALLASLRGTDSKGSTLPA